MQVHIIEFIIVTKEKKLLLPSFSIFFSFLLISIMLSFILGLISNLIFFSIGKIDAGSSFGKMEPKAQNTGGTKHNQGAGCPKRREFPLNRHEADCKSSPGKWKACN